MTVPGHSYRATWYGGARCYCHNRTDAQNDSRPAAVVEYQNVGTGVLFRVVGVPGHGIVYVHRGRDGELTAETFGGKRLPEVPPAARAAVDAYDLPG